MGWADNMQPGSFRGAPFLATSSDLAFGRNSEIHEFPLGETPDAQDLGRKARTLTLEVFVFGVAYMAQRDALISAFETPGPGTLIHPWQGSMQVQMRTGRVRETKDSGGLAVFTVEMVRAATSTPGAAAADTQALASQQADVVDAQGEESLADRLSVAGEPPFVQAGAIGVLASASTAFTSLISVAGCAGGDLFTLQATVSALKDQGLQLLSAPGSLAATFQSIVAQVVDLSPYPEDALSGLQTVMAFGQTLDQPATTTTSGQIEADNQTALTQVIAAAAAAGAVRVSASLDYASYNAAVATRDQLGDAIDGLATASADAGDDALYSELDALRLAMARDLTARAATLARLYSYTPPQTVPALVIAYGLYGDASQADAIVAQNAIIHPGFVPGGQPIQVLTDD